MNMMIQMPDATDRPQISVVINNYNYAQFLGEAVDSALAQDEVNAEVIVVDDGSTDRSREVIKSYRASIRPIFQENAGQAAAINTGVAAARAPILAFLDADDWFYPGKLKAVLAAFDAMPQAGLVYHRLQPTMSDGMPAFSAIPRSLCSGDLSARLVRSGGCWPFPMTSSLAVRRSVWDAAGDIPDTFRISADAWITGILPFLAPVKAIATPLGVYRIHSNTWYRARDDHAMLARRMAHWEETVRVTNDFLITQSRPERLQLRNHFAHSVAVARLGGAEAPSMATILWRGLSDPAEPNPMRRIRDSLGALSDIRRDRADRHVVIGTP